MYVKRISKRKSQQNKLCRNTFSLLPPTGKIHPPLIRKQAMLCGSHMPTLQPFPLLLFSLFPFLLFLGPGTNLSSSFLLPQQTFLLPPAIIMSSSSQHDSFHPGPYQHGEKQRAKALPVQKEPGLFLWAW